MKCKFCHHEINKCKTDQRGLCIKSPQSDGKHLKWTKQEKCRDQKLGY